MRACWDEDSRPSIKALTPHTAMERLVVDGYVYVEIARFIGWATLAGCIAGLVIALVRGERGGA